MRVIPTSAQGQSPELRGLLASGALRRIVNEGFTAEIFRNRDALISVIKPLDIVERSDRRERKHHRRRNEPALKGLLTIGATIFELEGKEPATVPAEEEVKTYRQLVIEYQPTFDPKKLQEEIEEKRQNNSQQRGG